MRYFPFCFILSFFFSFSVFSQNNNIDQLNRVLRTAQKSDDLLLEVKTDIAIGDYYCQIEKYSKSIRYYKKSIRIDNNEQFPEQKITAYRKISIAEEKRSSMENAQNALNQALGIAQKHNLLSLEDTLKEELAGVKSTILTQSQAENKYNQLKSLGRDAAIDSIIKETNQSVAANEEFLQKISHLSKEKQLIQIKLRLKKSELSKKELRIDLLNQYNQSKELELWQNKNKLQVKNAIITQKNIQNEKQKIIIGFSIGALILLILLALYIIRANINRKKHNKILEFKNQIITRKNKEISDSINYAKHIQDAILPSDSSLSENFKYGFVYFKPKDVVSGDFYWIEKQKNVTYFAVADCTGHGVPGAMVSVICANALNKALIEEGITETGKILDRTREIIIEGFKNSKEKVKDGMDISLCKLTLPPSGGARGRLLQWSGANNPLWIVKKDAKKLSDLSETKPNKQSIGVIDNPQPFTTHNFELSNGESIYIFSDGFADQFGGEDGKKFKYKPLKELLLSLSNENMDKQKETLKNTFAEWKGKNEQVDDVCIMGVRI